MGREEREALRAWIPDEETARRVLSMKIGDLAAGHGDLQRSKPSDPLAGSWASGSAGPALACAPALTTSGLTCRLTF